MQMNYAKTYVKDLKQLLREELLSRMKRNPSYSLRSFAKALDLDPSLLSKLMNGKKRIGLKMAKKLGIKLGLSPELLNRTVDERDDGEEWNKGQIALDSFKIISDWYHYAILELIKIKSFKSEPAWIANALGLKVFEVENAIERLIRVGLLEKSKRGTLIDVSNGKTTTVGSDYTAASFRTLQKDVLEMALFALENTPYEERDQSSMTMAIDSSKLKEAKKMIKLFRRKLASFLTDTSSADRVYNLALSLYPISKKQEES